MPTLASSSRRAGYEWLRDKYSLKSPLYHVASFVHDGSRRTDRQARVRLEYYPKAYWPGDTDFEHLDFALRREGLDLPLLGLLFPLLGAEGMTAFVRSTPTGIYARRLWYLYEALTGETLDLPDMVGGNYVSLLDEVEYYTGPGVRSRRQRVTVNLLGRLDFSPMVRRTDKLEHDQQKDLEARCQQLLGSISPELYQRTLHYLYTRETKSSFAIEREEPDRARASKFADLLQAATRTDYLKKEALVALQNAIVDPRFQDAGWRDETGEQVYVGTTIRWEEHVHFIAPRPQEIAELMDAFLSASRIILESPLHPIIAAAIIAYPFVFLHPFNDGNGRIHRFLIHYALAQRKFGPEGIVFPVSAIMLNDPKKYDLSLEDFSERILSVIERTLDSSGKMTVHHDTAYLYRFIDCTTMAEVLFDFVESTIRDELPAEIAFLRSYDRARQEMKGIVDLPHQTADLFVRICLDNNYQMSKTKRDLRVFQPLTDDEVARLEEAIRKAFTDED